MVGCLKISRWLVHGAKFRQCFLGSPSPHQHNAEEGGQGKHTIDDGGRGRSWRRRRGCVVAHRADRCFLSRFEDVQACFGAVIHECIGAGFRGCEGAFRGFHPTVSLVEDCGIGCEGIGVTHADARVVQRHTVGEDGDDQIKLCTGILGGCFRKKNEETTEKEGVGQTVLAEVHRENDEMSILMRCGEKTVIITETAVSGVKKSRGSRFLRITETVVSTPIHQFVTIYEYS